mgnify:CR=1 FL=1
MKKIGIFILIAIIVIGFMDVRNLPNLGINEYVEFLFKKYVLYKNNQQAQEKITKESPQNGLGAQEQNKEYSPVLDLEKQVIKVADEASDSVVSIIITKELPVIEYKYENPFEEFFGPFFEIPVPEQKGTEKKEVGGGSGFVISEDGLILTNKHVVLDGGAEYTAVFNNGNTYDVEVLAKDPFEDIAILRIKQKEGENKKFKPLKLGDSDEIKVGQFVVAIGNALGEFRNTVSFGVVSGLSRKIVAGGGGFTEELSNVIQTDAAINRGNSGGPLLNLKGEVIGINTAVAENAQNIGFAIPINLAKKDIEQVVKTGKITYPFIGIYYTIINDTLKEEYGLPVNYGAWVGHNELGVPTKEAIVKGSPAEKAGLKRNDIILEINGEKITEDNNLGKILRKHNPGDVVRLKVLREGKEIIMDLELGERKE